MFLSIYRIVLRLFVALLAIEATSAQTIPKTWGEGAFSTALLLPPVASATVKLVSADYYCRMAERLMYRRYPLYSSKAEPSGYLEKFSRSELETSFNIAKLKTEQDWIAAGREVSHYPISSGPIQVKELADFRRVLETSGLTVAIDGTHPHPVLYIP